MPKRGLGTQEVLSKYLLNYLFFSNNNSNYIFNFMGISSLGVSSQPPLVPTLLSLRSHSNLTNPGDIY